MKREELAWASGFFEGEGSVAHQGYNFRIDAAQVDREPLEQLLKIIGLGKIYGPYKRENPRARPLSYWTVCGYEKVQAVACMLWPWLSRRRKDQLKTALVSYASGIRPMRRAS